MIKKYDTHQDIIIHWFPEKCFHSKKCVDGLPGVFDFDRRPWIICENATPEEIISTIDQCPSGALKYSLPAGSKVDPKLAQGPGAYKEEPETEKSPEVSIKLLPGGPLFVEGPIRIYDENNQLIKETNTAALCRCGRTKRIPFCDGSHKEKD